MAGKYGSSSIFLLVDGYNVSSMSPKSVSYKIEAKSEKVTGIGDTVQKIAPTGISIVTIKQAGGYFDTATLGGHTAFVSVPTSVQATPRIICAGFAGQTVGEQMVGFSGSYSPSYEAQGQIGNLTKANVEYAVAGAAEHGVILHALGAETADANGTSVDNAASSSNGGAAYLQVTAYSGLTSAVFTVEHSSDNSSWSTKGTFTTVTAGPTAERIALASTINRYTRYVIDVTGTGSITFLVGLSRA